MLAWYLFSCWWVSQDLHNLVNYFSHFHLFSPLHTPNHGVAIIGFYLFPSVEWLNSASFCFCWFLGFSQIWEQASTPVTLCKLGNMGLPTLMTIINSISTVIEFWHLALCCFPGGSQDLHHFVIYLSFPLCKQAKHGMHTLVPISFPLSYRGKCWPDICFLVDGLVRICTTW